MARAKQAWFGRFTKASNLDFNVHDYLLITIRTYFIGRKKSAVEEIF